MRRACSLLLLSSLAGACEGPAAELTLVLEPFDQEEATLEATSALQRLRVVLRIAGEDAPQVFEFDLGDEKNARLASTVRPGDAFTVDVLGCARTGQCQPAEVVARGCTATLEVQAGRPTSIVVQMFSTAAPPADAPECGVGPVEE
jgi:hypothetical protein